MRLFSFKLLYLATYYELAQPDIKFILYLSGTEWLRTSNVTTLGFILLRNIQESLQGHCQCVAFLCCFFTRLFYLGKKKIRSSYLLLFIIISERATRHTQHISSFKSKDEGLLHICCSSSSCVSNFVQLPISRHATLRRRYYGRIATIFMIKTHFWHARFAYIKVYKKRIPPATVARADESLEFTVISMTMFAVPVRCICVYLSKRLAILF